MFASLPIDNVGAIFDPFGKFGFLKKSRTRMVKHDPSFQYEIFLRPGALEAVIKAKGIRSYTELAEQLKITKQYLSNLKQGKVGVSHVFIVRMAVLLNNTKQAWWSLYEIRPSTRNMGNNTQQMSKMKYEGQIPYQKYSPVGKLREKDLPVEYRDNSSDT
jgi:plasmid maintenance system antidote protein VapI